MKANKDYYKNLRKGLPECCACCIFCRQVGIDCADLPLAECAFDGESVDWFYGKDKKRPESCPLEQ